MNNTLIPKLQVVEKGILKGFVPVARSWGGFALSDYNNASRRVFADMAVENHRGMAI